MKDLFAKAGDDERSGRWADASQTLRQLVELVPDPNLLLRYASALEEISDYAGAEQAIRHAIRLAPDRADAYFRLGMLLDDQERLQEASEASRQGRNLSRMLTR